MKGRNEELIRFKYAFGSTDIKAILVTQNDENKSKKKKKFGIFTETNHNVLKTLLLYLVCSFTTIMR